MKTEVLTVGSSLVVQIPESIAREIGLDPGRSADIRVEGGSIVIKPRRRRYTLGELLEGVQPPPPTHVVDWGEPRGKEV